MGKIFDMMAKKPMPKGKPKGGGKIDKASAKQQLQSLFAPKK